MPDSPEHLPYRIMLRPIANPLPVSMVGLLIATSSVAALQLGWVPSGQSIAVGRVVVVAALFLSLPGALFGILARDPAGGTGMAILGVTWLSIGVTLSLSPPGSSSPALGAGLIAAAVALTVPIAASLGKPLTVVVLATCATRFTVTGISQFDVPPVWETAAGVLGLVLAVVAWYAAMAFELEDLHHKAVLPIGRRGPSRTAMESSIGEQVRGLEQEAGVRGQL